MNEFDEITFEQWKAQIITDLKGKTDYETLVWNTEEEIAVQPFYMQNALENNLSSSFNLQKNKPNWEIKEQILVSENNANEEALAALKGGCNSLVFVGEITTLGALQNLLKDIQLDIIQLSFYNNVPLKTAELVTQLSQNTSSSNIKANFYGSVLDDETIILSKLAVAEKTVLIKANPTLTIAEQLAACFTEMVSAVDKLTENGIAVKDALSKIAFHFSIQNNYFFEIAKLRAARICWELITNHYQVNADEIYITAETTLSPQPEIDAHNNTLAATTQAMSAIIGGCNGLIVLPYNSLNKKPTAFSMRIARNIQLILKEEVFLDKVIDPSKGAYYIETLTDKFVEKTLEIFKHNN